MPRSSHPERYPAWLHDFADKALNGTLPARTTVVRPSLALALDARRLYYSFCLALHESSADKIRAAAASAYRVTLEKDGLPVKRGIRVLGPVDVIFTNNAYIGDDIIAQLQAQAAVPNPELLELTRVLEQPQFKGPSAKTKRISELTQKSYMFGLPPEEQAELDLLRGESP